MRENQLPVHYKSAEDTGRVPPSVDSGDGGVDIRGERVTHVEAKRASNYLADDLSNSVQITLAKGIIDAEISSISYVGFKLADGTKVAFSLSCFNGEAAQNATPMRGAKPPRDSKLGTGLLASAVISVIALCTICNPKWVPSFVAQKAGAGTVAGAAGIYDVPTGRNPASAVQPESDTTHGTTSGAHQILASHRDKTGTRENSRRHATEMPKPAETKTSKSKKSFMVPPPPPTAPAFDFFLMQPTEQQAAPLQQLQQAQAPNQAAARENTPQESTAASGRTEATQSTAQVVANEELEAADQQLEAAVRSSQHTLDEWTR